MRTWSECSTFDTTQVDTLIIVVCLHHHVSVMNIARIAVLPWMVVQERVLNDKQHKLI